MCDDAHRQTNIDTHLYTDLYVCTGRKYLPSHPSVVMINGGFCWHLVLNRYEFCKVLLSGILYKHGSVWCSHTHLDSGWSPACLNSLSLECHYAGLQFCFQSNYWELNTVAHDCSLSTWTLRQDCLCLGDQDQMGQHSDDTLCHWKVTQYLWFLCWAPMLQEESWCHCKNYTFQYKMIIQAFEIFTLENNKSPNSLSRRGFK